MAASVDPAPEQDQSEKFPSKGAEKAAVDAPRRRDFTWLLALLIASAFLFPVLGQSGIWDPYELDVADLARRVAIQVFHASSLVLPNAQSSLPTLTDFGMGELPFTSMALGFRLLGMHDWSGRLPLAIWAFVGAAVLYAFLARMIDRRAGLYGVLALLTMPLFFMQARTMLGDAVTMAALTMAFCGLAGAMLDGAAGERGWTARFAWLGVGFAGLASGFLCRGLILGVAVPALGVGLTWVVLRLSSSPPGEADLDAGSVRAAPEAGIPGEILGAFALVIGVASLFTGVFALVHATPDAPLRRVIGFALLKKTPSDATFDLPIRQLGHALFPWSAFLPFAMGRLFRAPIEAAPAARDREVATRIALGLGAGVALVAYIFIAPYAGALPFAAPALLAGIAAVTITDLARGAAPSRGLAIGVLVLGFVLYRDMVLTPEKALSVFSVDKAAFPKSFEEPAEKVMRRALFAFAGLVALTWFQKQPDEKGLGLRAWFERRTASFAEGLREIAGVWNGNLLFACIVVEASLVGLGGMLFFGRRIGWAAADKVPFASFGVNAWWALPLGALLIAPVVVLVRDGFGAVLSATRQPRAVVTIVAALAAGGMLSFGYYPALAAQLSPKEVFESYAKLRSADEPLGLLGVRSRSAAYYKGGEVETFSDAARAYAWLTERADQRRWLIVQADDLPKLNSLYRKAFGANLPVLDGRSSQILLVSNQLAGHENESWIARIVLDSPPVPSHPLTGQFEDQLDVLGWDVTDLGGHVLSSVVPQTKYHLRFYYRVAKPVPGTWKAFVHIDGNQRRYNGDHAVLDGKYPMSLWQVGDVIVDDYEFQLEPNFTPGDYGVFFGFFSGETRFKVTKGPQQDNRVNGGALSVR